MSIERITRAVQPNSGRRFSLLYGPGVEDSLINRSGQELNIEQALHEHLKTRNIQRILFIAPHRPLYFLDDESERLTLPHQSKRYGAEGYSPNHMQLFQNGPLRERMVFQVEGVREETAGYHAMGDTHATRILDAVMKDPLISSALVFLQAETTLRYFEDPRTLAGMLGEWLRLPASNPNVCLFVFSADDYNQLVESATQIQVPEIRNAIQRRSNTQATGPDLAYIGYPEPREIQALIRAANQKNGLIISKELPGNLAEQFAAEPITARTWLTRLGTQKVITPETLRKNRWLSANRDPQIPALERLNQFVGLEGVKQRVDELYAWLQMRIQNRNTAPTVDKPTLHLIFSGNPGTGKTTVARLIGEIYRDLGLLRRGHLVEVQAADLIAGHVGGTALKTNAVIDQALDGVLFIDEAYAFVEPQRGGFGMEAIETLLTRMENDRTRLVVIAAGYPEKMRLFQSANPGLTRRFPNENVIVFPDYTAGQLTEITAAMFAARRIALSEDLQSGLNAIFQELVSKKDTSFGNAGEARNLVDAVERRRALRCLRESLGADAPALRSDLPDGYLQLIPGPPPPIEEILQEVNQLIGAGPFKRSFSRLVRRLQMEHILLNPAQKHTVYKHLIFQGNPGTGKTTAAGLVAKIYHALGLLRTDHCLTVTRSDLVAGYVGQTAEKTRRAVIQAVDGVLFIDEAYALLQGGENDFGYEAIDTLVKLIEEYPGRLLVIVAGYPAEMEQWISANPGLRSRFREPIDFPDFNRSELSAILCRLADADGIPLQENAIHLAVDHLEVEAHIQSRQFGNARAVQKLYDQMKENLAERVIDEHGTLDSEQVFFTPQDVPETPTPVQMPIYRSS